MLSMRKEAVISLDELKHVRITCPVCKVQITMDMGAPFAPTNNTPGFMPKVCFRCQSVFDTAAQELNQFKGSYEKLMLLLENQGELIVFVSQVSTSSNY